MRYIRTKDGIYKYADYLGVFNGKRYALMDDAKGNRITMCQEPEELYKTADIIEQLFDEFVFVDEFGKKDLLDDNYKAELQECGTFSVVHAMLKQDRPKELYGAIWTDKGLIYVAKMNERLEMELL